MRHAVQVDSVGIKPLRIDHESTFFIPAVNIMGIDCLDEAMTAIRNYGFGKALIVTDVGLFVHQLADELDA